MLWLRICFNLRTLHVRIFFFCNCGLLVKSPGEKPDAYMIVEEEEKYIRHEPSIRGYQMTNQLTNKKILDYYYNDNFNIRHLIVICLYCFIMRVYLLWLM